MSNPREKYYEKSLSVQGDLLDYDEWIKNVFWFPTGDGMRITFEGYQILSKHFPHYNIESDATAEKPRTAKHFIFLARFCRQPYYIYGSDYIVFFDEEEAFIFKLCDGDIDNVEEVAPERLP